VVEEKKLLAEIYITRLVLAIAYGIYDASNIEEAFSKMEKISKMLHNLGFKIPSKLGKLKNTEVVTLSYLLRDDAKTLIEKRSDEQAKIFLGKLAITSLTLYIKSGYYSEEALMLTIMTVLSLANIENPQVQEEIFEQIYPILKKIVGKANVILFKI